MSVVDAVVDLKNEHEWVWRDKPESYWFARLTQEVGELGSSLVGDHDDPPDWELRQIAAICLNWLEMRESLNLNVAAAWRPMRVRGSHKPIDNREQLV